MSVSTKPSNPNPKDALSIAKVPMSTVPSYVLMEVGLAMFEGARKYGKANYRVVGVRSSVYYDAAMRHLMDWYEGTDIDPDSGLSHLTKAIASLIVIRDAEIQSKMIDDRPPKSPPGMIQEFNKKTSAIIDKYPNSKEAFTQKGVEEGLYEA